MNGEQVLKKWHEIRLQIRQLEKEEESIRIRVKNAMVSKNLSQLRRGNYRVIYREMSRDTLSRKDCPSEVWNKYCRKITYPIVKLEYLGEDTGEEDV